MELEADLDRVVRGLLLTALPAWWLGEWPWVLLGQWMDLCRYVLQGAFTVQEILNALGWENTWRGAAVVLGIWGAVLAWCVRYRRARTEALFALLALANLAWTYHERHDFVLLAFLLVWFAAQAATSDHRGRGWLGLGLCAVLGAALADTVYIPAAPWAHAWRWAGRLAIPALWALTALEVRASDTATRRRERTDQGRGDGGRWAGGCWRWFASRRLGSEVYGLLSSPVFRLRSRVSDL
jgi:hypothetical protein